MNQVIDLGAFNGCGVTYGSAFDVETVLEVIEIARLPSPATRNIVGIFRQNLTPFSLLLVGLK
jgi:hypothetical protein